MFNDPCSPMSPIRSDVCLHRAPLRGRRTLRALAGTLAAALAFTFASPAAVHAHATASEASALSMLPVAVSVAAPVGLLVSGAAFTVVAVEAASEGTVWVLERASDGARASVTLSAQAVQATGAVSVVAGTAVVVTAFSAGWVLSAAGKALAVIPNELGRALLYNERVTR